MSLLDSDSDVQTDPPLYLTLEDISDNHVDRAYPNHQEERAYDESPLERFYSDVAEVWAMEQASLVDESVRAADQEKAREKEKESDVDTKNEKEIVKSSSLSAASSAAKPRIQVYEMLVWPFGAIVDRLKYAAAQIDSVNWLLEKIASKSDAVLEQATFHASQAQPLKSAVVVDPLTLRKQRLVQLIMLKRRQFSDAAALFASAAAKLRQCVSSSSAYITDLSALAPAWRLSFRSATAVRVDFRLGDLGVAAAEDTLTALASTGVNVGDKGSERGRQQAAAAQIVEHHVGTCRLQRADNGHVFLDEGVGSDVFDHDLVAAAHDSASSSFSSTSAVDDNDSSYTGWAECSTRLHRAQLGLLHRELHHLIMRECMEYRRIPCASLTIQAIGESVLIQQSGFSDIIIAFPHGSGGKISVQTNMDDLPCVTAQQLSDSLWTHLLCVLLDYYLTFAANHRPAMLSRLAFIGEVRSALHTASWRPASPIILPVVAAFINHRRVRSQIADLLAQLQSKWPQFILQELRQAVQAPQQQRQRRRAPGRVVGVAGKGVLDEIEEEEDEETDSLVAQRADVWKFSVFFDGRFVLHANVVGTHIYLNYALPPPPALVTTYTAQAVTNPPTAGSSAATTTAPSSTAASTSALTLQQSPSYVSALSGGASTLPTPSIPVLWWAPALSYLTFPQSCTCENVTQFTDVLNRALEAHVHAYAQLFFPISNATAEKEQSNRMSVEVRV